MGIEERLTGGDPRSLGNTEQVVAETLANADLLPELFECMFSSDEIVRMRAGDAVEKICNQHPDWLQPYIERLLTEVYAIRQPSVQWHLAQMLAEVSLSPEQKPRAIAVLRGNLETMDDWIVTNLSLESLAQFTRRGDFDRARFVEIANSFAECRHKSVASRVRKLLREFGG